MNVVFSKLFQGGERKSLMNAVHRSGKVEN